MNKFEIITLHSFKVHKCCVKWVAYKWHNKLTTQWWIKSNIIDLSYSGIAQLYSVTV